MNDPPQKARLFAAIPFPQSLLDSIKTVQNHLQTALNIDAVKWTPLDQIHLTLKFYGNVELNRLPLLTDQLQHAATHIHPFSLALAPPGCFPNPYRPQILWIGLIGDLDTLKLLQHQITTATADFVQFTENRPFHPHATIGRVKGNPKKFPQLAPALAHPFLLGQPWPVTSFHLVQSRLSSSGPAYSTLATVTLIPQPEKS